MAEHFTGEEEIAEQQPTENIARTERIRYSTGNIWQQGGAGPPELTPKSALVPKNRQMKTGTLSLIEVTIF